MEIKVRVIHMQPSPKGTFTHGQSGRGGKRVENWLQHKSLHVFTYIPSLSGDRAGAKSSPQEMGTTPNFPHLLRNHAPQSYFCPHRHGRSSQGTLPSTRLCVNMSTVAAGISKSTRLWLQPDLCMCECIFRNRSPPTQAETKWLLIFFNWFSCMKIVVFVLNFHQNLFPVISILLSSLLQYIQDLWFWSRALIQYKDVILRIEIPIVEIRWS